MFLGGSEDGDVVVNLLMDVCAAVGAVPGEGEKHEVEAQKM